MPRGKGRKKAGSVSRQTQKSVKKRVGRPAEKSESKSTRAPAPRVGTRPGLRSNPAVTLAPISTDPNTILRKPRNLQRTREAGAIEAAAVEDSSLKQAYGPAGNLVESIEAATEEDHHRFKNWTSNDWIYEVNSPSQSDPDPEEEFNNHWGYLPPLNEEAAAIIEAVLARSDMAQVPGRINPSSRAFPNGLEHRNVSLKESPIPDDHADHIRRLEVPKPAETDDESKYHRDLWTMDRVKCNEGSNEALFQRTIMMSLIARYDLIYERNATKTRSLDFNVEEPWVCPPMPTEAYSKRAQFLTQPKPDLAVSFCRGALLPNALWRRLPDATTRLAFCESSISSETARIFPFFTIEAKKANTTVGNNVGMLQSLNNASQALHNMYEFFKDAGQTHEAKYFGKVRFFSAVSSTEGLIIRIHRATQEPADGTGLGLIMPDRPDYPLRFEHSVFYSINKDNFDREPVLEMLGRILISYGVNELLPLLREAAQDLVKRLTGDPDEMLRREGDHFYRYGQVRLLKKNSTSRNVTEAPSSEILMSAPLNANYKRARATSEDRPSETSSRRRKK